jgi:DNA-binding IclR family transcriptional regulator
VQLAVLDGVQAVYVEKVQPTPAVRIDFSHVGIRLPAHCIGLGKAMLAYREWEEIAPELEVSGLPSVTANTITDMDLLREELRKIRQRGYAYDEEESVEGLCCVAAPLRGGDGEVVAALSISAPAYRFEPRRQAYTKAVLEAARRISESASSMHVSTHSRFRALSGTA